MTALKPFRVSSQERFRAGRAALSVLLAASLLAGCVNPIGADRVGTRQAYDQVDANALRTGKPSANTASLLHRYDLVRLASRHPDEAVKALHQKALATGDRDALFALAELSYVAADQIRHSLKPWDTRDARDYYLGSAVYAWLFLIGECAQPRANAFDRRFREACDFYNYSLGLAFTGRRGTNAMVNLQPGRRALPVGEIQITLAETDFSPRLPGFDEVLLADQYRVRGLSTRNRDAGIGTPLICVSPVNAELGIRQSAPATAFLRLPRTLAEATGGSGAGQIEVYSALDNPKVEIAGLQVPLETDLTTYRAYTLNQEYVWSVGMRQFLAPARGLKSQLLFSQPYTPGRIPVVFVHGTFSSPVTWAEMMNTLTADPVLRSHYQLWTFVYSSGNPLAMSASELRDTLTETVHRLDPHGTDPALHEMIIIGHSQGGLLTKLTAVDTGDKIFRVFTTNRLDDLKMPADQREYLEHLLFLKPLPFVSRVIFISTPHRGSYLAGGFARRWARRLMSLPARMVSRTQDLFTYVQSDEANKFFKSGMPTSLDSMSPKNPALVAIADLPIAPGIKANSIIPVTCQGDYQNGRDGLVTYKSAHVDGVESECVVRAGHSCLNAPSTIEEVRRILLQNLQSASPAVPAAGSR
jgi:pimeloyl-ACP methyl ester carboxylesterase